MTDSKLTSIYTVTREDLYDFRRCPKIVAIKTFKALRTIREKPPKSPRFLEPATIGKIGEAAVQLGLAAVPQTDAMRQITRAIPEINLSEALKRIALESLVGVDRIRGRLSAEYGEVSIIGRGEGRHPDLASTILPDFIAFTTKDKEPILVETKDSTRRNPSDEFQAMFYNGVAERYGVYLLEERLEQHGSTFSPRIIRSKAETVLIYPRLAQYSIVKDRFTPEMSMIKQVWEAKQLGLMGKTPETRCGSKCAHLRLRLNLPEGNTEPIPPVPLIFSQGIIESGHDLDMEYQVEYAWRILPRNVKLTLLSPWREKIIALDDLRNWLVEVAGLSREAVEVLLDPSGRERFNLTRPGAETLLKSMSSELEPWERILGDRLKTAAPAILGRATSVYSLPSKSFRFVRDTWKRWTR